jgi:hypothetical protein
MKEEEKSAGKQRILTLLLLIGSSLVTPVHGQQLRRIRTGQAQVPEIIIARGQTGKAPAKDEPRRYARPARLSQTLKQSLLKSAGIIPNSVETPFTLTPATAMLPGKGGLDFVNATFVSGGAPPEYALAGIGSQTWCCNGGFFDKRVTLLMQATAGKKYMIDFAVDGAQTYYVNIDWALQQTFSATQHLLIIYEATSNATARIMVTGDAQGYDWVLGSVEVTPLN